MSSSPNAHLRVVEIAQGLAAPLCGRLFAGLGHDVLKIEPRGGDFLRTMPPLGPTGESLPFVAANADKRSVVVASDQSDGQQVIHRFLDDADIAIVDLSPRLAADAGLDQARVRLAHPELVVVSITGFGTGTPYSDLPADSMLAEAYGGLATMIGDPNREPLSLGGEQCAHAAAVTGFLGAMLALSRRDQGAGGDFVDVAMCDVAAYMDWKSDVGYALDGCVPKRSTTDDAGWRLVKASDGWLGVIFQQRHWDALVDLVGAQALADPALRDEATRRARADEWWPVIEAWARERAAKSAYEQAQAAGLPFGWVATAADLVRSEQLASRDFIKTIDPNGASPVVGSPMHCDALPWKTGPAPALGARSARPTPSAAPATPILTITPASETTAKPTTPDVSDPRLPLTGVTVLDFGTITAGAAVSRLLADYGATVLKIEWIDKPDTFRFWKMTDTGEADPSTRPLSPYFASNNVGKLDVAINLKDPEGRQLVYKIARASDVVIENYRVGVTRRLGIDSETLLKLNPELLYLSLSSQGQQGPEAANSSYGSTLDLLSGLASVTGYNSGHPLWSSSNVNYPDQLVSLLGAAAIVYCLREGIVGTHLDVSQREVVSWTLGAYIADYVVNHKVANPEGNRRPGRSPHGIYPCSQPDTWVAISCADAAQRTSLVGCIGAPDACDTANGDRRLEDDHLDASVVAWTSRFDRAECVRLLQEAGVPAVPVLDTADRARDPRFTTRLVTFPGEALPVKGFPMLFTELKPPTSTIAPALGAHTRAVLTQVAGVPNETLEDLCQRGVVHCAPDGREIGHGTSPAAIRYHNDATAAPLSRIEQT